MPPTFPFSFPLLPAVLPTLPADAFCPVAAVGFMIVLVVMSEWRSRRILKAFARRDSSTIGSGMTPLASVLPFKLHWSPPAKLDWNLEQVVIQGNQIDLPVARLWFGPNRKLVEAETAEGRWLAQHRMLEFELANPQGDKLTFVNPDSSHTGKLIATAGQTFFWSPGLDKQGLLGRTLHYDEWTFRNARGETLVSAHKPNKTLVISPSAFDLTVLVPLLIAGTYWMIEQRESDEDGGA